MYRYQKKLTTTTALLLMCSFATFCSAVTSIYVSPQGNDASGNGSQSAPYQSIKRAQQAVRAAKGTVMADDIVVYLRGGIYSIDTTLVFRPQDGGTASRSVTYQSYRMSVQLSVEMSRLPISPG